MSDRYHYKLLDNNLVLEHDTLTDERANLGVLNRPEHADLILAALTHYQRGETTTLGAAASELAGALKQLVNAPLPPDLHTERDFWVACRNARATLDAHASLTNIDGGPKPREEDA